MPVEKIRAEAYARRALSKPRSPENLRRLAFVLDFWSRLRPRRVPNGVFKYRSPEEAQRDHHLPPP